MFGGCNLLFMGLGVVRSSVTAVGGAVPDATACQNAAAWTQTVCRAGKHEPMNKRSLYDDFMGKMVSIRANDECISGRLLSIDGYMNVALEMPEDMFYIKGTAIDYVALDRSTL